MKTLSKRLFVLMLGCLVSSIALADDAVHYLMYVNLADGNRDVYCIADHPVVTFDAESVLLKTDNVSVQYALAEVVNYQFAEAEGTDIKTLKVDEKTRYAMQYVDNQNVMVRGAKSTDRITVYSISGKKMNVNFTPQADGMNVSLDGLAKGQYVVSVEGKVSIKIQKK